MDRRDRAARGRIARLRSGSMAPTTASIRAPNLEACSSSLTRIAEFWSADNAAHVELADASAVRAFDEFGPTG